MAAKISFVEPPETRGGQTKIDPEVVTALAEALADEKNLGKYATNGETFKTISTARNRGRGYMGEAVKSADLDPEKVNLRVWQDGEVYRFAVRRSA